MSASTSIKFQFEIPPLDQPNLLWDDQRMTPALQKEVNKLGPRSKTNGLMHLLSRKDLSYDSLYQYLRLVVLAVHQVYGSDSVEVVAVEERTNSIRLMPLNSLEEEVLQIYFEAIVGEGEEEPEDVGERPIKVVDQVQTPVPPQEQAAAKEQEGVVPVDAPAAEQPTDGEAPEGEEVEKEVEEPAAKKPRLSPGNEDQSEEDWNHQFTKLQAFHKQYGHFQIESVDEELSAWLKTQRELLAQEELAEDRKNQLESIGLEWKTADATTGKESPPTWDDQYKKLQFFHQLQGHCNVPMNYTSDPSLPIWVRQQRQLYHKDELTQPQMDQLNSLHFIWGLGEDEDWDDFYARLVAAQGAHDADDELGQWVSQQRELKESNQLSDAAVTKLESIGFEWKPSDMYRKRKVARKSIGVAMQASPVPVPVPVPELPNTTTLLEEKIQLQEVTVKLQGEQVALLKEKLELHGTKVELQKANRQLTKKLRQLKNPKSKEEVLQELRATIEGQDKEMETRADTIKNQDLQIRQVLQQIQEKKEEEAKRAANDMTIAI